MKAVPLTIAVSLSTGGVAELRGEVRSAGRVTVTPHLVPLGCNGLPWARDEEYLRCTALSHWHGQTISGVVFFSLS